MKKISKLKVRWIEWALVNYRARIDILKVNWESTCKWYRLMTEKNADCIAAYQYYLENKLLNSGNDDINLFAEHTMADLCICWQTKQ